MVRPGVEFEMHVIALLNGLEAEQRANGREVREGFGPGNIRPDVARNDIGSESEIVQGLPSAQFCLSLREELVLFSEGAIS